LRLKNRAELSVFFLSFFLSVSLFLVFFFFLALVTRLGEQRRGGGAGSCLAVGGEVGGKDGESYSATIE
jgi:hypothetical protein